MSDGLSPGGGRHHFFEATSFSIALSSIASAKQLLQLGVLVFQRLQPPGVRHFKAAVLGLPFVERRAADPVLAAHVGRLRPGLVLPQDPDDLLFREPARLHVHPLRGDGLYPFLEEVSGLRSSLPIRGDGYSILGASGAQTTGCGSGAVIALLSQTALQSAPAKKSFSNSTYVLFRFLRPALSSSPCVSASHLCQ